MRHRTSKLVMRVRFVAQPPALLLGARSRLAPAAGLIAAGLISIGRIVAVLWLGLLLLAAMLLMIRNLFGVVVILVCGVLLYLIVWHATVGVETAVAYGVTWFLLVSGPKGVLEAGSKPQDATALTAMTHEDLVHDHRREARRGFVHDDHLRVREVGAGQRQHLLLAAGQQPGRLAQLPPSAGNAEVARSSAVASSPWRACNTRFSRTVSAG